METQQMRSDLDAKTGRDKRVYLTSSATDLTYSMEVGDSIVHVTTVGTNTMTVTLPPVSLAVGQTYVIRLITDGGDCVVQDNNDDAGLTDITFDTVLDFVVLLSDGTYWYELLAEKA